MDYPRHLISHTVTSSDLRPATDAGLRADWITDPESARVWRYLLEFQASYGQVPSAAVLAAEYPTYKLLADTEPIGYVIDQLRDARAMAMLEAALDQAVGDFERGDVRGVRASLSGVLTELATEMPVSRDVDITQTGAARMERYRDLAKRDGKLVGIPTGFAALDAATGGFRKQQLIVLVGPPKAGKSTALLWFALAAHAAVKSPFTLGFEMSNDEVEERLDALRAQVSATKLRDGNLSEAELRRVEKATRQMELMTPWWLSSDIHSATTVSGVSAKIQALKPDIAFIDGIYMMQDDHGEKPGSPQALTNISRAFKRLAQAADIPTVVTSQVLLSKMQGGQVELGSIGYTSALGQDADLVIAVEPTQQHDIFKIKLLAGRNVAPFAFFVRRDWAGGVITELDHDPFGEDDFGDDDFDDDRF
ncbi:DnaB-like helicase C-terminal domain-containing protein [Streptosporangium sp. NPDC023825]|uniref:DnaB-like helicase C-terminal domain-containing protein n=1 Tax=Streptosporangium sp. NPDC023825 TaxID=3154909 RepID=UPI0034210906